VSPHRWGKSTPRGRSAVLAVLALAPAFAGAQTVDEIVAKHLAARGGGSKIAAIESLRMTAKARAEGGREAVVVREAKRPGRLRLEFTAQGVTGVYAYDGERGWCVSPFDGQLEPEPMPPEATRSAIEWSDIGGPLVDWKAKGHRVELAGREPLEGGEAWKLKVTLKGGDVRWLYLDARSFLQVRTEATRSVAARPITVETTFGDYRGTAGVLFPHAVEIGVKGRPTRLRILVQNVEVNPVLDDARFRMPDSSR
jgi:outer membrane lipoprotein-sorting protein